MVWSNIVLKHYICLHSKHFYYAYIGSSTCKQPNNFGSDCRSLTAPFWYKTNLETFHISPRNDPSITEGV